VSMASLLDLTARLGSGPEVTQVGALRSLIEEARARQMPRATLVLPRTLRSPRFPWSAPGPKICTTRRVHVLAPRSRSCIVNPVERKVGRE
jgi:hypothetical protein